MCCVWGSEVDCVAPVISFHLYLGVCLKSTPNTLFAGRSHSGSGFRLSAKLTSQAALNPHNRNLVIAGVRLVLGYAPQ